MRWVIDNRDAFSADQLPAARAGRPHAQEPARRDRRRSCGREIAKATRDYGARSSARRRADALRPPRLHALRAAPRGAGTRRDVTASAAIHPRPPDDIAVMQRVLRKGLGGAAFRDDRPLELLRARRGPGRARAALVPRPRAPLGERTSASRRSARRFGLALVRSAGETRARRRRHAHQPSLHEPRRAGDGHRQGAARRVRLPPAGQRRNGSDVPRERRRRARTLLRRDHVTSARNRVHNTSRSRLRKPDFPRSSAELDERVPSHRRVHRVRIIAF